MTEHAHNAYGDPDSPLFSQKALGRELADYRRRLNDVIPWYVPKSVRHRIMKAADELAWARARERYAAIKEMPDWRLDDIIPARLRLRNKREEVAGT